MFNRGKTSLPYLFLGPSLLVMLVLGLVPTVAAINLALKNRVLRYPDSDYVWLRNVERLLSDRRFLNAIEVSAIWEVVTVLGAVVAGEPSPGTPVGWAQTVHALDRDKYPDNPKCDVPNWSGEKNPALNALLWDEDQPPRQ